MSKKIVHLFEGRDVDVSWNRELCIHIAECGRAKGNLFELGRQPWCNPDVVENGDGVAEVIERCPSGALSFSRKDGGREETPDAVNTIFVSNRGPLYIRGELRIDGASDDMPGVAYRAALCRCGKSQNKPFCDNAHENSGFDDHGAVGEPSPGNAAHGGPLDVNRAKNGPLLLSGNMQIVSSSGRVAWHGTKAALCRCGQSENKPFCDGSHKPAGFEAE